MYENFFRVLSVCCILVLSGAARGAESASRPSSGMHEVVFPNRMYWAGSQNGSSRDLVAIFAHSHRMAIYPQPADSAFQGDHSPARNAESAEMAYALMRNQANHQLLTEMTVYFAALGSDIPADSQVAAQLKSFAESLIERANGKGIVITAVGSTSRTGKEAGNLALATSRASAPLDLLSHYLRNVPHDLVTIAAPNGLYSNPVEDTTFERRDQYVRLTPLFADPTTVGQARHASPAVAAPPQHQAPAIQQQQARPLNVVAAAPQAHAPTATRTSLPPQEMHYIEPPPAALQNSLGMEFAYIPPGSFMMGSPADELLRDDDERLHRVTISRGFYMQRTEVTLGQWHAIMKKEPAHFYDWGWDYPVEKVSWVQVNQFIKQLNDQEGTNAYRLPTEAEWEYACRAGTSTAFYNVEMHPGEKGENEKLGAYAWYYHTAEHRPHRVAQKEPNAWGLYDMHGNVWEWCSDWQSDYPFDPVVDPKGPSSGPARIRRGGSWSHFPTYLRSANRSWYDPNESSPDLGFRLVRDLGPTPVAVQPAATPVRNDCEYRSEENGRLLVRKGIPSSNLQGTVYVERDNPSVVNVGELFQYKLRVHNGTNCALYRVIVTEQPPAGFIVHSTKREAEQLPGGALRWEIRPMAPGASEEFIVTGVAMSPQDLEYCALVDFTVQDCATTRVVQPMLELTMAAPPAILACDQLPLDFTVVNSGTGTATGVELRVDLPQGLVGANGERSLVARLGDLAAGARSEQSVRVQATETGTFRLIATLTGEGGLQAQANHSVSVKAPRLRVTASARGEQYAGRPIVYTARVTNIGDAAASNLAVSALVPRGMSFVAASHNASAARETITWIIANLAPNETTEVQATLQAEQPGAYTQRFTAQAHCAPEVIATADTQVQGIAAILLEVADLRDPLEVGETGTYVIVATNQGSIASTNVVISCQLEANLQFISADGATPGTVHPDGRAIAFAPLNSLQPQTKATWQVKVKALNAGDVRFMTELNSDQLTRPVEETEATTIY